MIYWQITYVFSKSDDQLNHYIFFYGWLKRAYKDIHRLSKFLDLIKATNVFRRLGTRVL